jgi:hypothetical protein
VLDEEIGNAIRLTQGGGQREASWVGLSNDGGACRDCLPMAMLSLARCRLARGEEVRFAMDFISILSIFVLACFRGLLRVVWSVTSRRCTLSGR